MDESLKQDFENYGIDLEMTLYRFLGNEEMYEEFIHEFMEDQNYFGLIESLPNKDYERAFCYAHTLKGVAGNLGLDMIQDAASRITEALRNKKPEDVDTALLGELTERLQDSYAGLQKIMERHTG